MSEEPCSLGIYGLTNIGQQLAAHHASHKTRVAICDDDPTFVPQVVEEYRNQWSRIEGKAADEDDGEVRASTCMLEAINVEELLMKLQVPRKIVVFGTHGDDYTFGQIWNKLESYMEEGDMVLRWGREDPGNALRSEFFTESAVGNLTKQASGKGLHLLEMVRLERDRISENKGETPDAFFVGGDQDAYDLFKPFLEPFATVGHVGNSAACAHYAVMIQRAVEFSIMQAYGEGTRLLRDTAFYQNNDVGRIMLNWNDKKSKLAGYLTDISSRILYKRDKVSGKGFVTEKILDIIDSQTPDTWVRMEATRLEVPTPTLNAALDARYFTTLKEERVEASKVLNAPNLVDTPSVLKEQICEDLQNTIYCTSICAYAEALSIIQAASEAESWNVNILSCIELWNIPGSFLESAVLKMIDSALSSAIEENKSILTVPDIAAEFDALHMSWRRTVSLSFACGVAIPCFSAALTYYDSYRTHTAPIGLARAQRDFFGGYGYDRFDQEGWFTTLWTKEHTELKKRELEAERVEKGLDPPKKRKRRKPAKSEQVEQI